MLVCGCKSNKRGSWPSSRQRTQKEDRKENAERGLAMDGLKQRTWKFHSPWQPGRNPCPYPIALFAHRTAALTSLERVVQIHVKHSFSLNPILDGLFYLSQLVSAKILGRDFLCKCYSFKLNVIHLNIHRFPFLKKKIVWYLGITMVEVFTVNKLVTAEKQQNNLL